jgi:hypothetical protein
MNAMDRLRQIMTRRSERANSWSPQLPERQLFGTESKEAIGSYGSVAPSTRVQAVTRTGLAALSSTSGLGRS